jgi:hypothetical protein
LQVRFLHGSPIAQKIRVSSDGKGNDARIVYKRLRLSFLILLKLTVTGNRNGLRHRNLYPKPIFNVFSLPRWTGRQFKPGWRNWNTRET